MAWNPFIEVARDPVAALSALAYALGLLALLVWTAGVIWSNAITALGQYRQQRPRKWQYVPPATWLLRVGAIPAILAIDAWAVAALIWLVT